MTGSWWLPLLTLLDSSERRRYQPAEVAKHTKTKLALPAAASWRTSRVNGRKRPEVEPAVWLVAISFFNNYLFQYKMLCYSIFLNFLFTSFFKKKKSFIKTCTQWGIKAAGVTWPSWDHTTMIWRNVISRLSPRNPLTINTWQFKRTKRQTNKVQKLQGPTPGGNMKLGGEVFKIRVPTGQPGPVRWRNAEKDKVSPKAARRRQCWSTKTSRHATLSHRTGPC